jgi:hypothetical protein
VQSVVRMVGRCKWFWQQAHTCNSWVLRPRLKIMLHACSTSRAGNQVAFLSVLSAIDLLHVYLLAPNHLYCAGADQVCTVGNVPWTDGEDAAELGCIQAVRHGVYECMVPRHCTCSQLDELSSIKRGKLMRGRTKQTRMLISPSNVALVTRIESTNIGLRSRRVIFMLLNL